jgi:hypothetical protein
MTPTSGADCPSSTLAKAEWMNSLSSAAWICLQSLTPNPSANFRSRRVSRFINAVTLVVSIVGLKFVLHDKSCTRIVGGVLVLLDLIVLLILLIIFSLMGFIDFGWS